MSFLTDFCVPALALSSAALVSLRLLGDTSLRFRTSLAVIGVLAWFVPWSRVMLPIARPPNLPLTQWIDSTASVFDNGTGLVPGPSTETPPTMLTGSWWFLLFVPGALHFLVDIVRRTRRLERLERNAKDGEYLRSLLPASLQSIPGRIRIVPGSNAMATGMRRGTIWVGEGLCAHSELKTALVHECCHLRRRDPGLILAVNLVRRLYCWNPVVALLCRQLLLLFEQACDANAAAVLGKSDYRRSLARLLLDARADDMTLVPGVLGSSSGYRRIRAIESGSASALRRLTATVMTLAAGLLAVSVNAQQRDPRIGEWREGFYPPNSVGLYMIYEDLGNGMTRVHSAENLAQQNRLHQDIRCDGKFYPYVDAKGVPNGISTSCTVVDARTVTYKLFRETGQGREEGEGTWTLSSDGNRYTTVTVWRDRDGNKGQANERRFTRNAENCLNHAQDELFRECQRRSRPPRE
jgi:beta-lactamase regulating signal transducer with metallopeptidase domain